MAELSPSRLSTLFYGLALTTFGGLIGAFLATQFTKPSEPPNDSNRELIAALNGLRAELKRLPAPEAPRVVSAELPERRSKPESAPATTAAPDSLERFAALFAANGGSAALDRSALLARARAGLAHPKRAEAFAGYERDPTEFGRRFWFMTYAEVLEQLGAPDSMNSADGQLRWHYMIETKDGGTFDFVFAFFDGFLIACY